MSSKDLDKRLFELRDGFINCNIPPAPRKQLIAKINYKDIKTIIFSSMKDWRPGEKFFNFYNF